MIFEVWAFGFARGKEKKKKNSGNAVGNQSENAGVAGMNPTKWKRRKKNSSVASVKEEELEVKEWYGKEITKGAPYKQEEKCGGVEASWANISCKG